MGAGRFPVFFLILTIIARPGTTAEYDLIGSIVQGLGYIGSEASGSYRVPAGVGIGFRAGDFAGGLRMGADFLWAGYPVIENEVDFGFSSYYGVLFAAGWTIPVLYDGGALLFVAPEIAIGFYSRSVSWQDTTKRFSRPQVRIATEAVLVGDRSLYLGTRLNLNGYLDVEPVWGLSVEISAGYRFGGGG